MSDTVSLTSEAPTAASADTVEFNRDELAIKSLYRLSEDLIKFFEKTEECDVTLEIGKEPDFKKFGAHSSILRARSSYFYKALSKKSDEISMPAYIDPATLYTNSDYIWIQHIRLC